MKRIRASAFKMACQKAGSEDHLDPEFAQLSRLAALGAMLTAIAHEINQPLFAIQNYARASTAALSRSRSGNRERLTLWMGQISQEADRARAIIDRLRDFGRRTPPRTVRHEVRPLVEEAVSLILPEARRRQILIHLDFASKPRFLYADRVQVQQVLVNLLKNACEAIERPDAEPGEITVQTRWERGSIHFSVSDNGCGLPAVDRTRIFEPFFTTKSDGLGIGLAVSRAIIEAVRGRLWAEPNTPRGAVFHFTVPSRKEAADEQ